jgi:hypothetical protein
LDALYAPTVRQRVHGLIEELLRTGHVERRDARIVDRGLTPDAVRWFVHGLAGEPLVSELEDLGHVVVNERGCVWLIRIERAQPGMRYFGMAGGFGLYYQADGAAVDAARAEKVMSAVVQHVGRMVARSTPAERLSEGIAEFLGRRVAAVGIEARAVLPRKRRHRLTVVAPG